MKISIAGIIVWRGKVYLPVVAQFESGIFVQVKPVYVADLDLDEIVSMLEKVRSAGHVRLPDQTREEWRDRKDPVLVATGAKSWKELARFGASYGLEWSDQGVRLDMTQLDKKGRWEVDPNRTKTFPRDTSLHDLVKIILDDIRSHPKLLNSM